MREMGCTKDVVVGAWYTAPYGIRVVRRGGVVTNECKVEDRITTIRGCALPMKDNDRFMASAYYIPAFGAIIDAEGEVTISKKGEEFHHGFVEGNTVLDINLSNVNPVIHVPGTVLAVSTMQNFDTVLGQNKANYSLYAFGACPAIAEVQAKFWEEEKALAKAMEVGLCTVNYEDFFSRTTMYGKEYMGPDFAVPYEENYQNFWGDGPFDLENRYITEDVPVGCYLMSQLGKKYNVPTPIIDSMILLASTMLKARSGRRLQVDAGLPRHRPHDPRPAAGLSARGNLYPEGIICAGGFTQPTFIKTKDTLYLPEASGISAAG